MSASRERGASGFLVAIVLVVVLVGLMALLTLMQGGASVTRSLQEEKRFETIKSALLQFVSANGRLPCPGNPATETGAAEPNAASATCTYPAGAVPWAALGIRRDDAIDAWGWKISYRVYTGNKGSLTQADGASMVKCDTVEAAPADVTAVAGSSGGLCRDTYDTLESQFISGKGLAITWFGTAVADAAWVLVSHGPTGYGAYLAGSATANGAPAAGGAEASNLLATGPFVAKERSAIGVSPASANHFDDVLAYQKLADLIRLAGRGARDWGEFANLTLDKATVQAALGTTIAGTSQDLGTTQLDFGTAQVTGLASGVSAELAFTTESGGREGLGGAIGSGDRLSSGQREGLRIQFNRPATALGITLTHFGIISQGANVFTEQVRLDYYDAGGALLATQTKRACRSEENTGRVASFSLSPGTSFVRVDITAIDTTAGVPAGPARDTDFILSAFVACNSIPCTTGLHDPTANACS